jgi:hypothetical protein
MQTLQVEGRATISTDEKELCEAGGIIAAQFSITADIHPNQDTVMIKIEPEVLSSIWIAVLSSATGKK